MTVLVTREPFSDYFVIQLESGQSEELEPEEARTWFAEHGANMDAVEKCLDHVWNFRQASITITDFRLPKYKLHAHAPQLD
jgi:hypothetical protein